MASAGVTVGTTSVTTRLTFPPNYNAYGGSRAGMRLVLEDNGSNDWNGLGINTNQVIYMAGASSGHYFKVNNTLCMQVDTNGITFTTSASSTNVLDINLAGVTTSIAANKLLYLDGVTSGIQNQLNSKQASGSFMSRGGAQVFTANITASTADLYSLLGAKPSEIAYLSGVSSNL